MYGIKYPSMDLVTYYNLLAYVFMLLYTNNAKIVVYKSFILNFTSLSEIEKWLSLSYYRLALFELCVINAQGK